MKAATVAFGIEQTLGHRAHTVNIRRALTEDPGVSIHEVPFETSGPGARLPWAIRGSRVAYERLAAAKWDVAFLHTQSISLFAPQFRGRHRRYVVSVDATPVQIDAMARGYTHRRHPAPVERAKRAWYTSVFGAAKRLVAWSDWAAESLVSDYGVERGRITVVHPGAARSFFELERRPRGQRPVRVLFVGGDFERKGGRDLLAACGSLGETVELVVVTEAQVAPRPGLTVLRGIEPGTSALLAAFADADIFCLPTHADCTPVVLGEAMAAGLPIVTTTVGSNPSVVADQETGYLVAPGHTGALEEALRRLVSDAALRERMGRAARERAKAALDADANSRRLLALARDC